MPYAISKASNGDISFNNEKIVKYYNLDNQEINQISVFSRPKNTNEIISGIKARQLSSLTPVDGDPGDPLDEDPYEVLSRDGFRNNYWIATQNYTDLASYTFTLNAIGEDIVSTTLLTIDEKITMYTEIEYLK